MTRGGPMQTNADVLRAEAVQEANGDVEVALTILAGWCAYYYEKKGAGFDREGGPQHPDWRAKRTPKAIVTAGGY